MDGQGFGGIRAHGDEKADDAVRIPAAQVLETVLMRVLERKTFALTAYAQRLVGWNVHEPVHAVVHCADHESFGWLRLSLPSALLDEFSRDGLVIAGAGESAAARDAILCGLARSISHEVFRAFFGADWSGQCSRPKVCASAPCSSPRWSQASVLLVTGSAQCLEAELVVELKGEGAR
jgi:hypothetical protein